MLPIHQRSDWACSPSVGLYLQHTPTSRCLLGAQSAICDRDGRPGFSVSTWFLLLHSHFASVDTKPEQAERWIHEVHLAHEGGCKTAGFPKKQMPLCCPWSRFHSFYISMVLSILYVSKTIAISLYFQASFGACNKRYNQACLQRSPCHGAMSTGSSWKTILSRSEIALSWLLRDIQLDINLLPRAGDSEYITGTLCWIFLHLFSFRMKLKALLEIHFSQRLFRSIVPSGIKAMNHLGIKVWPFLFSLLCHKKEGRNGNRKMIAINIWPLI